jgi:hypothetical protein
LIAVADFLFAVGGLGVQARVRSRELAAAVVVRRVREVALEVVEVVVACL